MRDVEAVVVVGLGVRTWHKHFKPSLIAMAQTDLALRMRNQLAVELLERPDEHIIDDEPVLLSDTLEATEKTRGTGLPKPGWMLVTNQRVIYASLDHKRTTELHLRDARVTHLEDGWVTFAWRADKNTPKALTVGFKPKTKMLREIVSRIPGEKVYEDGGAATPGMATRLDRLSKSFRRGTSAEAATEMDSQ